MILPCGGWDLNRLIMDGQINYVQKLLLYPAELRFSNFYLFIYLCVIYSGKGIQRKV
jgi:hypothetical protein